MAALEAIAALPDGQAGLVPVYLLRAALHLSVGRVAAAGEDLDMVAGLAGEGSRVLAMRSIIALVQNDAERAMELARLAQAANAADAAAAVALSYAQQARFDVASALATLQ